MLMFTFVLGFCSQSGATDVYDSKAGADLLDIIRRKVCLSFFVFNVL